MTLGKALWRRLSDLGRSDGAHSMKQMLERHPWREVCKGSEKYASWNGSSVADWKTHWLTLLLGRARLFSKVRGMD